MKRFGSLVFIAIAAVLLLGSWAQAADDKDIALPAGTQLVVRLTNTLSSKGSDEGDPWAGKVEEPVWAGGEEVVPADSTVRGRVTFVQPPGRATGKGEMRLVAETVAITGHGTFTIVAKLKDAQNDKGTKLKDDEGTVEGPGKSAKEAAKEAGIGAAVGAGVGTMAHGGSGALYGMAIGAVAGIVHVVAKKHQGPLLPAGTELTFTLDQTFLTKRVAPPPRSSSTD